MLDSVGVDEGLFEGDEAGVGVVEILVMLFLVLVFDLELTAVLDWLIDDEGSWEDEEAEVDVVAVAVLDRPIDDEGS